MSKRFSQKNIYVKERAGKKKVRENRIIYEREDRECRGSCKGLEEEDPKYFARLIAVFVYGEL